MRAAFRLLVMIAVLWCGLHLDEPAHAHEDIEQHQVLDAPDPDGDDRPDRDGPSKAAHVHHHCPMAAEPRTGTVSVGPGLTAEILFPGRVAVLHSLSQAPPVEPPSA